MAKKHQKRKTTIPTYLIAPCGMNCRLCLGYIREENTCPGCFKDDGHESQKSQYRKKCRIRNCEQIVSGKLKYCSDRCNRYPCTRLKQLDTRYSANYGMSMIENLQTISEFGIRHFIRNEKDKWACPECGQLTCVHKPKCLYCGYKRHL